jgi:serine/threonine protein kinase
LQVGIYKALLDTASGLDYLHSIGVVHGDLKTANVLLKGSSHDARGVTCKISDFGLSRVLDLDASHISTGTYGEPLWPRLAEAHLVVSQLKWVLPTASIPMYAQCHWAYQ